MSLSRAAVWSQSTQMNQDELCMAGRFKYSYITFKKLMV